MDEKINVVSHSLHVKITIASFVNYWSVTKFGLEPNSIKLTTCMKIKRTFKK